MSIRGVAAIVGASETTRLGKIPDMSVLGLHLDAARNAVADCGIDPKEIDGVATTGSVNITPVSPPVVISYYLGLTPPKWIDSTSVGGGAFMMLVRHAAAAIAAGMCNVVLITHGESGRSGVGVPGMPVDRTSPWAQFERPYGPFGGAESVPDRRASLHEGLRPYPRTARHGASVQRKMGGAEPAGDGARTDLHRRCARFSDGRLPPHAPDGMLSGGRRWRRGHHDHSRTGTRHEPAPIPPSTC